MKITSPKQSLVDDARTIRNFVGSGSGTSTNTLPNPTDPESVFSPPPPLPGVGDQFLGFRLVRELGRGAFGRVFLATQGELAGRLVALKVTLDLSGESGSLAQLQHTNIVPVYSVHHDRGLHAVCMPYFGGTTLAHLLRHCHGRRPESGAELVGILRRMTAAAEDRGCTTNTTADPGDPIAGGGTVRTTTAAMFDRLAEWNFPRVVCWMVARVADGLAHAHDRGIIHRDIKPANVLLTDDGQPMLLDFGVAADLKARVVVDAAAGTVAYMAPEQLAGLFSLTQTADPRCDVYSLGVILFEWLTGTHPFSQHVEDPETDLPRLLEERRRWVPRLRSIAPDVPADLEAVVRTCVAADPARRYQSAADLSEDLRRVLAHEPLRVALEPGGWYRMAKWRRRHPKFGGQLFVVSSVLVGMTLSLGATAAWQGLAEAAAEQSRQAAATAREQDRIDALARLTALKIEVRAGRYRLAGRVNELGSTPADMTRLRDAVMGYGLPDDTCWRERPAVVGLPAEKHDELFTTMSEACLLLARAGLLAEGGGAEAARVAERMNTLAGEIRPGPIPRAVYNQRADICARLDRPEESRTYSQMASNTPLVTAEDHFLSGDDLLATRRYADAVPLLREAVRLDPTHFWAQFQLGVCHHQLNRPAEARACYSAAVALRPDFPGVYFNRAMATVPLHDHAEVVADLDVVLRLEPENAPAHLHRGHALATAGHRAKGMADLDAVLAAPDPGGMHVRAYLQRAKWKKSSGDVAGAQADIAAALQLTPTDEIGWLLRGLAQVETNLEAALFDIQQAVRLNPRYVTALRNQVYILERLKRYEDAMDVMERVIPLAPRDWLLLASRGGIAARLGRADHALRDITRAMANDQSLEVRKAAATAYTILSKTQPELRVEALRLLSGMLRDGLPIADLKNDPDFTPLHDDPEFKRLTSGK